MALNLGILIIGSLLWDEERRTWREARLDVNNSATVTAPIRYGRLSGKRRGHTYTMVFSRLSPAGHARAVRCARRVASAEDLLVEAEYLWKAEELDAHANRIGANWGCVALLCNPERKIPNNLAEQWAHRVAREPGYGNVSQAPEEGRLISVEGLLQIDWPHVVGGGEGVDFDLLLGTANDPTLRGTPPSYPSVETMAHAWNCSGEHVSYFWNNFDNGITTFQDNEIRARLLPRRGVHSAPR
jgi:hypothetical protein